MKTRFLNLVGLSLLALTSCGLTPPESYGEDFATPEFFLARLNPEKTRLSVSGESYTVEDYDLVVRDTIFKDDDFEQIDPFKPSTKTYFSYYTDLQIDNSSPRYAEMFIYTDGKLRIDYKEAIYKKVSFYHAIEPSRAQSLYDLVKGKVEYAKDAENKAKEQAKSEGSIEKFVEMSKNLKIAKTEVLIDGKWGTCYDKGEIANSIANTTHKFVSYDKCESPRLKYNYQSDTDGWAYYLDSSKPRASIRYHYKDELNRKYTMWFTYSIGKDDWNSIYNIGKSYIQAK